MSLLDTRKMDEQMIWLVEHLEEAFKNGSPDTAQRIQTALIYGVGKGMSRFRPVTRKKSPTFSGIGKTGWDSTLRSWNIPRK